MASRGTTHRNIRIDDERWAAFGEIAEERGTDRSAMVRAWIDELRGVTTPPAQRATQRPR